MKNVILIFAVAAASFGFARDTNRYDRVETREGFTFSQRGGLGTSNEVVTAVSLEGIYDATRTNSNPSVRVAFSNAVNSVVEPVVHPAETDPFVSSWARKSDGHDATVPEPSSFDATKLRNQDAFFTDASTGKTESVTTAFSSAVNRVVSEEDPAVSSWARKINGQDAPKPDITGELASFAETGSVKRISSGSNELRPDRTVVSSSAPTVIPADSFKTFENYYNGEWAVTDASPKTVSDIGNRWETKIYEWEGEEYSEYVVLYVWKDGDVLYGSESNVTVEAGETTTESILGPLVLYNVWPGAFTSDRSYPITESELETHGTIENAIEWVTTSGIGVIAVTNGTSVVIPGNSVTNTLSVETSGDVLYSGDKLVTRGGVEIPTSVTNGAYSVDSSGNVKCVADGKTNSVGTVTFEVSLPRALAEAMNVSTNLIRSMTQAQKTRLLEAIVEYIRKKEGIPAPEVQ